jgi:hypothetical protein
VLLNGCSIAIRVSRCVDDTDKNPLVINGSASLIEEGGGGEGEEVNGVCSHFWR